MKIVNKIKNLFLWIIGIAGSIFLFFKIFSKEKEINIDRLKGQNDILSDNLDANNLKLENVDQNIESIKEEIKDIKEDDTTEDLDDFFDDRGF